MQALLLLLLLFFYPVFPKEVKFSIDDRERLIKLEMEVRELKVELRELSKRVDILSQQIDKRFEQIDKRFEHLEKQIDRLVQIMVAIFAGQIALVGAVIGILVWDRRSMAKRVSDEALERFESGKFGDLMKALKELAIEDKKLAEVLRKYNLL